MPSAKIEPNLTVETGQDSPLSAAITQRDRDIMQTVQSAIRRREVLLAFQPVVQAVEHGQTAFYEGLIRVIDESGRVIPARDFIDTIETTELGRMMDCLSLEMGLIALAEAPDLRLAVNMSARSIGYPRWKKILDQGLARDDTIAERLILEITESSAMVMPDLVTVFMRDLQSRGIAFALDDFGAGYTAFRYLREFYFDILKIDGQFIRGIADNPDNQVLASALIAIAQHFDMFTVAENVETARDAAWLAASGIDCMQGFAFGAPSLVPPWREGREKRRA
ncbi:EAL domain, c-di-GMP-specific phosphodiesterase class I (or its enzymatically inactive variant) [Rhodovulum sp. ES.010]|uniref:EAL domain-containing protein n=1 Tax=Rhodovulum sp. ES.010 TaxID=1882821 RepID=UPI00092672B1|nr:EAL domain-containing protein [Rhodovulum sp. ES.010]SIO46516.1 EAL domain, c-di-GMP-specific phosphodiesterase class I (or its enzymatically inactive variant) [Rhodovulum sp. ES.010]